MLVRGRKPSVLACDATWPGMRTRGMGSPGSGGDSTARSVAAIVLAGINGGAGKARGGAPGCTATGCGAWVGGAAA
jgi:hypothetical protein